MGVLRLLAKENFGLPKLGYNRQSNKHYHSQATVFRICDLQRSSPLDNDPGKDNESFTRTDLQVILQCSIR